MIHLLKVLYYQYFRFYKRFERFGEEPHPHARYSIALNLIGFVLPSITFPLTYFFCIELETWFYIAMIILTFILIEVFHRKGIDIKIEKEMPKLMGSTRLSIIFAIMFWAGSFVSFSLGAIKGKEYRKYNCIECRDCK